MLDKNKVLKTILDELYKQSDTLKQAAMDAKEAATNEESKAENKYDTRGLEASYLAGAQAKRAKELNRIIAGFEQIQIKDYDENTPIESTALVDLLIDEEETRHVFVVPSHGGMVLNVDGTEIMTVSPDSPLGKKIFKKKVGDYFEMRIKEEPREYEITKVY